MLGLGLLALAACSAEGQDEAKRLAMPEPATKQAPYILDLWIWMWVAAAVVGIIVWGLIGYAVIRFRRRSDTEIPVQTRYHLPLEVFYTAAPVIAVAVIFYWTVVVQDKVLAEPEPDRVIDVVGQQWSWTFNYTDGPQGQTVFEGGTGSNIPTLWMPVGETVRINLNSPDVIHSFWVPAFLMKMDVIPGRDNSLTFTPTTVGEFVGKCAELCGAYHSRMLFNVKVVSAEEYDAHLQDLLDAGNISEFGYNDFQEKQAGLDEEGEAGQ